KPNEPDLQAFPKYEDGTLTIHVTKNHWDNELLHNQDNILTQIIAHEIWDKVLDDNTEAHSHGAACDFEKKPEFRGYSTTAETWNMSERIKFCIDEAARRGDAEYLEQFIPEHTRDPENRFYYYVQMKLAEIKVKEVFIAQGVQYAEFVQNVESSELDFCLLSGFVLSVSGNAKARFSNLKKRSLLKMFLHEGLMPGFELLCSLENDIENSRDFIKALSDFVAIYDIFTYALDKPGLKITGDRNMDPSSDVDSKPLCDLASGKTPLLFFKNLRGDRKHYFADNKYFIEEYLKKGAEIIGVEDRVEVLRQDVSSAEALRTLIARVTANSGDAKIGTLRLCNVGTFVRLWEAEDEYFSNVAEWVEAGGEIIIEYAQRALSTAMNERLATKFSDELPGWGHVWGHYDNNGNFVEYEYGYDPPRSEPNMVHIFTKPKESVEPTDDSRQDVAAAEHTPPTEPPATDEAVKAAAASYVAGIRQIIPDYVDDPEEMAIYLAAAFGERWREAISLIGENAFLIERRPLIERAMAMQLSYANISKLLLFSKVFKYLGAISIGYFPQRLQSMILSHSSGQRCLTIQEIRLLFIYYATYRMGWTNEVDAKHLPGLRELFHPSLLSSEDRQVTSKTYDTDEELYDSFKRKYLSQRESRRIEPVSILAPSYGSQIRNEQYLPRDNIMPNDTGWPLRSSQLKFSVGDDYLHGQHVGNKIFSIELNDPGLNHEIALNTGQNAGILGSVNYRQQNGAIYVYNVQTWVRLNDKHRNLKDKIGPIDLMLKSAFCSYARHNGIRYVYFPTGAKLLEAKDMHPRTATRINDLYAGDQDFQLVYHNGRLRWMIDLDKFERDGPPMDEPIDRIGESKPSPTEPPATDGAVKVSAVASENEAELIQSIMDMFRDMFRQGAPTHIIEPIASFRDRALVTGFLSFFKRKLNGNGQNIHTAVYESGKWDELKKLIESMLERKNGEGFNKDVTEDPRARLVIRLAFDNTNINKSEQIRNDMLEFIRSKLLEINGYYVDGLTAGQRRMIKSMVEKDIMPNKIQLVIVNTQGAKQINTGLLFMADLTMAECDRYIKRNYKDDGSVYAELEARFISLLKLSITNYRELIEEAGHESASSIINSILNGYVLRVRGIAEELSAVLSRYRKIVISL
ncbi:MAG: hypothetical protein NG740_07150, partial [Omnitrophica bacterium]|nr:hypothetical protein [Candidatus Omnitrophota bacterium]